MRKILLIVSSNKTGLQYYRQLMPHNHLLDNFEGFLVQQAICDTDNFDNIPDDLLKGFHCVSFLRQISLRFRTKEIVDRCHRLGLKVFFDIDDYWRLPQTHAMYEIYKQKNYPKNIEEALKYSDVITTTNVWLQNQIKKINPNVYVVPNCIDGSLPQYKQYESNNKRLRFGWIGGVYHLSDIRLMGADFYKFYKDEQCINEAQLCLGGYTKGQREYRDIEKEMTNNYTLEKTYKEYLLKDANLMTHIMNDKPYKRLYSLGVEKYMRLYNEIDVSLIPLNENLFNACKSELKMIEAGTMGKACIVSEVKPYILCCNSKNSLVVNRFNSFFNHIKYFLNNRNAVKDYAEALGETIKEGYNIMKINEMRCQLYNYYLQ